MESEVRPEDAVEVAAPGTEPDLHAALEQQRQYIRDLEARLTTAEAAASERVQLRDQLVAAEQQLAELPGVRDALGERERQLRELARQLRDAQEEADGARDEARELRLVLERMRSSVPWLLGRWLRRSADRGRS